MSPLILKKYLVGFLGFGVRLAVLSFSCATEGPTSVIPHWQKGKCESESALSNTRRGYSVNCTPARLTLLREECRRGFACLMRYAAGNQWHLLLHDDGLDMQLQSSHRGSDLFMCLGRSV